MLPSLFLIRRTSDRKFASMQHVRVNHRRLNILISQELLHRSDIVVLLESLRSKARTKRVATDPIADLCQMSYMVHRFL